MRTDYTGPFERIDLQCGGRVLRIVRPADPDRLLIDPDVISFNRDDDYMPYWAYLWPGAYLLAEAVAGSSWPAGLEGLEIGCGLGLAGLAALVAGVERVTFSDYDTASFDFVARNLELNQIDPARARFQMIDWRDLPDARYPLVLGADVMYERRLVPLVADVAARLLTTDGEAWIAGPYRAAMSDLPSVLDARGLLADEIAMTARDHRGEPVRGTLHRVRRRGPVLGPVQLFTS
jgi:predicted nicotinamide N-methyase